LPRTVKTEASLPGKPVWDDIGVHEAPTDWIVPEVSIVYQHVDWNQYGDRLHPTPEGRGLSAHLSVNSV
jgi:hypothetical protein